jgi:hypothetical protein
VIGVLLLLAGLVTAGALWLASSTSVEDNVGKLARAPSGCQTTLEFDKTGTFYVFFERVGRVGDLEGGCSNVGGSYDRSEGAPADLPTLEDESGAPVELGSHDGISYDEDGFVGSAVARIDIDEPGRYVMTVPEADEPFAYAVGPDPAEDKDVLLGGAIAAGSAGLVLGGLLIVLGLRGRRRATGSPPLPPLGWQPTSAANPWGNDGPPAFRPPPPGQPAGPAPGTWAQQAAPSHGWQPPRPWDEPTRAMPRDPGSTERVPAQPMPGQPFPPPPPPPPPDSSDDLRWRDPGQ